MKLSLIVLLSLLVLSAVLSGGGATETSKNSGHKKTSYIKTYQECMNGVLYEVAVDSTVVAVYNDNGSIRTCTGE